MTALERARVSLIGLAMGDGFGERFFSFWIRRGIAKRRLPRAPWRYTDDTAMAISIFEVLRDRGGIDQDLLARRFASRYAEQMWRGYGPMAHQILQAIGRGVPWRDVSTAAFDGQGSMGNGGAMRAGPIGAYFANDLSAAAEHARRSAEVTHAHPEGQAGAIAVAIAAAVAAEHRGADCRKVAGIMIRETLRFAPEGKTHEGLKAASRLSLDASVHEGARQLGNGSEILAHDTVPFTVWCAAKNLGDYEEALWDSVSCLGDRDTTCAIVGSIVAPFVGISKIPAEWTARREPMPDAIFGT